MNWFVPLEIGVTGHWGPDLNKVCEEFLTTFNRTLDLYNGPPISLQLNPTMRLIHLKAHWVPFILKPKTDEELDCFIIQRVLEPVPHGLWEIPIVTLVKLNGSVCICIDYKCTFNKALLDHAYPDPFISHILSMLPQSKVFGSLHLAQAYQHCQLTSHHGCTNHHHAPGCFSGQVAAIQGECCPQDIPESNRLPVKRYPGCHSIL